MLTSVKRQLRARVGLWPLLELRNRAVLGRRVPGLRRFETAEVRRLRADVGVPTALVVTVIPTFRRPQQLRCAVRSALAQTIQDHRVIVVDDGAGVGPLPADPRLVVVSLSHNTGVLGLVRNVGIRTTSSEFIAFLDDDNEWRPDHLETALAGLRAGADLVYTAVERRRSDGELVDTLSTDFDRAQLADGPPYVDSNAIVVRRSPRVQFSRIPRVKATLPKEDWEFVYRMSRSLAVAHLPVPTVRYLINTDSFYTSWAEQHG
ncbi:MAG: glycosyltransferase family 2 protein [Geodermatophilaceae bacterium]